MDDEQSNPSCCKAKNTLKYAHGNQAQKIQFLKQTLFFCHHKMWIGLHSYYAIRTAFNAFFIFQLILFSQKSINALCQNFCNNLFCHSQALAAFGCYFLLFGNFFIRKTFFTSHFSPNSVYFPDFLCFQYHFFF